MDHAANVGAYMHTHTLTYRSHRVRNMKGPRSTRAHSILYVRATAAVAAIDDRGVASQLYNHDDGDGAYVTLK